MVLLSFVIPLRIGPRCPETRSTLLHRIVAAWLITEACIVDVAVLDAEPWVQGDSTSADESMNIDGIAMSSIDKSSPTTSFATVSQPLHLELHLLGNPLGVSGICIEMTGNLVEAMRGRNCWTRTGVCSALPLILETKGGCE